MRAREKDRLRFGRFELNFERLSLGVPVFESQTLHFDFPLAPVTLGGRGKRGNAYKLHVRLLIGAERSALGQTDLTVISRRTHLPRPSRFHDPLLLIPPLI